MLGRTAVAVWSVSAGIALTGGLLAYPDRGFAAGPMDACDAITGSGEEILEVTVSPVGSSVTVRTPRGSCVAKLNDWVSEPPPSVPPMSPASEAGRTPPGASTSAPAPSPAPVAADASASAKRPQPWENRSCVPLADVWKGGTLRIGQNTYALSRIYTLDRNSDAIVDDVAFVLEARGASNLVVRYRAEPGILSAKMLPDLRLEDDALLSKLCFGTVQFEIPELPAAKPLFQLPNLAAEARAKEEGQAKPKSKPAPAPPPKREPVDTALFALGLGVFFGVAGIGGAVAFVISRRRAAAGGGDGDVAEV